MYVCLKNFITHLFYIPLNYEHIFNYPYIHSGDETGDFQSGLFNAHAHTRKLSEKTFSNDFDSAKMPPPKFPSSASSGIKKRKSKRSMDYGGSISSAGTARSAPVTPTSDRSPNKVYQILEITRYPRADNLFNNNRSCYSSYIR